MYFLSHLIYHLIYDEVIFSHPALISFIPQLQIPYNSVEVAVWHNSSDTKNELHELMKSPDSAKSFEIKKSYF